MTWLRDHKRKTFEDSLDVENDDGPAWIRAQTRELRQREYVDRMREFEEKLQEIRQVEQKEKDKARFEPENGDRIKRRKKIDYDNDDVYLVDDYESDSEKQKQSSNKTGLSDEVLKLLEKIGEHPDQESVFDKDDSIDDKMNGGGTKIFFTSRTHSQLSQFVGQLRLTSFPPVVQSAGLESESVKEIPLSSRKQLCIHPKVSKLRDTTQQNDACHDMQKKESTRCEFLLTNNKLSDRVKSTDFRNRALAQIRDIEDLADLGKEMNVCPYYESRKVIPSAEIVSLPYQLLLQKSSRKALNIDLKDSVVIIDEAHNILETMSSLYSLSVTLSQVSRARQGLEIYSSKFSKRLNGANKIYLAQFIKVVSALEKFFTNASKQPSKETAPGKEINQNSVLSGTAGLVNMYKLEKYLEKSKIAFKIETYLEKLAKEEQQETKKDQQLSLSIVCSFLLAISNPSSEGKLFYARTDNKELQLQYLLLDPSEHFREISQDARCVILAGGTMEPVNDYMNYLFPYVDKSDISLFSCNHVIPDENLSVSPLSTGPTKVEFLFTFAQRNSEKMMDDLGRTLFNLSMIIPSGLVIFFPSYQYLDQLEARWKRLTNGTVCPKRRPSSASLNLHQKWTLS
jgi:chromosome transmission fidelity protein 1